MKRKRLGVVTDGAFNAGLTVRLDAGCSTEDLRIGDFVIVEGKHNRYFSMISDLQLRATDPTLLANPPRDASPFITQALSGINTYATVEVRPRLMLEKGDEGRVAGAAATEDDFVGPGGKEAVGAGDTRGREGRRGGQRVQSGDTHGRGVG